MKKIDYYAVQNPWKMPKWLGVTLGGIFGVIAVGSVAAIVQITKSNAPAPIAAVGAVPSLTNDAPATKPVLTTTSKKTAVVAAASVDEPAPVVQPKSSKRASKHHASKSKKASMRLASAKKSSIGGQQQRTAMLAKHDTKSKRNDKDALDKLLGL